MGNEESMLFRTLSVLRPEEKLAALEAMGFRRERFAHELKCPGLQGNPKDCVCNPPISVWSPPADVVEHLGETEDERRKFSEQRMLHVNGMAHSPGTWTI